MIPIRKGMMSFGSVSVRDGQWRKDSVMMGEIVSDVEVAGGSIWDTVSG